MMTPLTPLRRARLEKGLTQWDLMLRTDIPQSKISMIEREYCTPSQQEARRIAKALRIKTTDIFGEGENK
jgi:DNA-binding XRE family transcriptional regulator